jgi:predicted deacetylase
MTLLCSIHDVTPCHLNAVRNLRERLAACGVSAVTLLVVPRFHGDALERSPHMLRFLRDRVAAGDEVCLHGFFHRQSGSLRGLARLRSALFTAGEGECLCAGDFTPFLRDGRALLEDIIGARVRGFVAPAWLEPPGFARLLAAEGFCWHEDRFWLEQLAPPRRVATPVISFATRTAARRASSLAAAALLRAPLAAAARLGLTPLRLALHPSDHGDAGVMAFAEATARALATRVRSPTYSAWWGAAAARA